MRHRILLAAPIVYLCVANIVWVAVDIRPPFWDMANHAGWALGVLRDFQQHGIAALLTLPRDSGSYPPLYYSIVAFAYWLLGPSIDVAVLANLPAILLLALATYGIARTLMEPAAAAFAATIVNFIPFLLWLSHEAMIEYWLTALGAAAIWVLLKTKEFSNPKWSVFFGVLCGLGMLTKWTFVIYVGLPAFWAARKNLRNAVIAAVIAGIIASYWYVPQFATMPKFWRQATVAAENEHDATIFSIQGWLFYIRALEGSLLLLPLFVAFLAGVAVVIRKWGKDHARWTTVVLYLLGSWLGLMLLPNQDPRYATGALPAIAIFAAAAFEKRTRAQIVFLGILVFQHVLVTFGIPQLPESVTIRKGPEAPIRYDWNVYTQSYFGMWGKPERQDWQIDHVLQELSAEAGRAGRPVKAGVIPDLPRFDVPAFQFAIDLHHYPVVISRQFSEEEASMLENDFLLMSDGEQSALGSPAPHAAEINAHILAHPERFQLVETFRLPNGETIRLYRCVRL